MHGSNLLTNGGSPGFTLLTPPAQLPHNGLPPLKPRGRPTKNKDDSTANDVLIKNINSVLIEQQTKMNVMITENIQNLLSTGFQELGDKLQSNINVLSTKLNNRIDKNESKIKENNGKIMKLETKVNEPSNFGVEIEDRLERMSNIILGGVPEDIGNSSHVQDNKQIDNICDKNIVKNLLESMSTTTDSMSNINIKTRRLGGKNQNQSQVKQANNNNNNNEFNLINSSNNNSNNNNVNTNTSNNYGTGKRMIKLIFDNQITRDVFKQGFILAKKSRKLPDLLKDCYVTDDLTQSQLKQLVEMKRELREKGDLNTKVRKIGHRFIPYKKPPHQVKKANLQQKWEHRSRCWGVIEKKNGLRQQPRNQSTSKEESGSCGKQSTET